MEPGRSELRRPAQCVMGRGRSSKLPERCDSMCRARGAGARGNCGRLARRAAEKEEFDARKRLTCGSPREWRMAEKCACPVKAMRARWERLREICICK